MKEKHDVFYRLLYNMMHDTLRNLDESKKSVGRDLREENDINLQFFDRLRKNVNEFYPHLWEDLGLLGIANYVSELHPESEKLPGYQA